MREVSPDKKGSGEIASPETVVAQCLCPDARPRQTLSSV